MAKNGNIVNLKHNWPKEQLIQKANYNWKSINDRIQKLETDIKSGIYVKNYPNNQNRNSSNSTISRIQNTTYYNEDSGYDSQGAKNSNIEAVKNTVAEVESMADEAISAADDIINNKLPELKEGVTQELTNTMAATYVKNDDAYSAVVQNAGLVASKVSNSEFNSYKTQVPGLIAEQVSDATGNMVRSSLTSDGWQLTAREGTSAKNFMRWDRYGNLTLGDMDSNSALQFSNTSAKFSNGIELNTSGAKGLFWVTPTITKTISKWDDSFYSGKLTISEMKNGKSLPSGYRPLSLVRYGTNHTSAVKITSWNLNPGCDATDNDSIGLTFTISRYKNWTLKNGKPVTNYPKMNIKVYFQILWIRTDITYISKDNDIPGQEPDTDAPDESSTGGILTGKLSSDGKTLTVTIN